MKNSSNLILYKASAGSGKTYTLAKAYLKIILLNPYDYNKILAVTFTKKATAEMKSRIIEYLSELEKNKEQDLKESIINEIKIEKGIDIREDFNKNTRVALQLILHDYSNFNISTIDSFFQSIIRSFAKELDLPIGMAVELDTDAVIMQSVEEMLKEYKSDKDAFSRWIERYVFDLIDEDKSWKIEKNISKLARQILSEEYQLLARDSNQQFDIETYKNALVELKKISEEYRKKLDYLTTSVQQKIQSDELDLSLYFQGARSIQSFINNARKYEPAANSYVEKMLCGESVYSKSKIKDESTIILLENAWNTYLKDYIDAVLLHKQENQRKYNSAGIVLKNIYALALLAFINTKIIEHKAAQNLILISDTNQIVSLIATHEEVPFIFEKSANFLKYILIDEFQDTSSLQWTGMLPLLLEILQNIDGLVLIVGDPKQSIYRWRGGKMELIINDVKKDIAFHWKEENNISLKSNFRSAKEIVDFNNSFFSTVKNTINLQNPLFKEVLADVEQELYKKDKQGFVSCKWLEKNKDKNEDDVQLQEVLRIIKSLEDTKKYKDFAILTRNNQHGALVANYLQKNDIPVVSAESLLLQNQLSIKLLIAALEYISNVKESFYAVKFNYLYASFLKEEKLEEFLQKKLNSLYFFQEKMPFFKIGNVQNLSSVAINELLFLIIKELGLDVQTDSYLWRFQDIVLNFSQTKSTETKVFLNYWNEQKHKLSILPPDGIDAVKIYTIHKSKGLQFPIVIIPYCNWSMKPKAESTIWLKNPENPFDKLQAFPVGMTKKMEESLFQEEYNNELEANYIDNINLLYVAFTRPEEQLYILSTVESTKIVDDLPQSTSKLLYNIIPKLDLKYANHSENEFTYGNTNTITEKVKNSIPTKNTNAISYHNFKEKIELRRNKNYNEAQIKGNILHDILSKIKQPNQLQKAISITTNEDVALYANAAQKVIDIFNQNNWFDKKWQALNERNLFVNDKFLRADKILLSDDECIIIDYKTGTKEKGHITQMKEYIDAYSSLHKHRVSAYLLYIENLELLQIQ